MIAALVFQLIADVWIELQGLAGREPHRLVGLGAGSGVDGGGAVALQHAGDHGQFSTEWFILRMTLIAFGLFCARSAVGPTPHRRLAQRPAGGGGERSNAS